MAKPYKTQEGCEIDATGFNMSPVRNNPAAEQNAVSAESESSRVFIAMNENNSWRKRHRMKKAIRLEGWPPGVVIPKELLDQRMMESEHGKEDQPEGESDS